jgi:CheY-like chemotaxis protein
MHTPQAIEDTTIKSWSVPNFRAAPDGFDLVITDMAMPNLSGDRLATELIHIRPDIPILLCTGFSNTLTKEKASSLGIRGFILKPFFSIFSIGSGREKQLIFKG